MAFAAGTRLGNYEIVSAIGAGGMGEVYRAHDTRLGRDVALKVLPAAVAANPERRTRFTQEARAIAALTHPNIVTVHSIEDANGVHFLTMELVEGQSLDLLIPGSGMRVDLLLRIASPLADAVAAAHARGITHRDLKPANVMVTPDGRPKVLDFGLAKLQDRTVGADGETYMASGITGEGKIVGTVAYMSPEQAEGKPVDSRTDIFSLGVMLYEMATGQRPFKGDSSLSTLSAILRDQPAAPSVINPNVPRDLSQIIRKCLAKDPERRYQSAKDLRNDIDELGAEVASGAATMGSMATASGATAAVAPARGRRTLLLAVAGVAVVVATAFLLKPFFTAPPPAPPAWRQSQLTSIAGQETTPAISPDGRWIAYGHSEGAEHDIFLHGVGGSRAINLTERSGVINASPAFSPDGERIAFWSSRQGGGIFVMGRTGESVRRLTDTGDLPSWSADGKSIVFCTNAVLLPEIKSGTGELWIVSADSGGPPRKIEGPFDAMRPRVSPTSRRIAYWGLVSSSDANREIFTVPIDGGTPVRVTTDPGVDWNPVWAPDGQSLYFLSNRAGAMQVWQVGIDESSGVPSGEPVPLATPARYVAHLSISADGTRLAYAAIDSTSNLATYGFDPVAGKTTSGAAPLTSGSRFWTNPAPSPDGSLVAFTSTFGQEDLFVIRADGSGLTQLTNDAARDRSARWAPDGRTLAFHSDRDGAFSIWTIQADGRGLTRVLDPAGDSYIIPAWSPDGQKIVASKGRTPQAWITERTAAGWGPARALATVDGGFMATDWSADGRSLIGMNGASLIVMPADGGAPRVVSRNGIGWPVWLPDSRRVLFVTPDVGVSVIDIAGGVARIVAPGAGSFGLSLDGRRLVVSDRRDEADVWMMERSR